MLLHEQKILQVHENFTVTTKYKNGIVILAKVLPGIKITIMKHILLIKIHSKRALEDFISHHVLF